MGELIDGLGDFLAVMRMPRAFRSCYNCANRYKCGVVGAPPVPLLMDEGQRCGFWRPQEMSFVPSETELAGLKMHWEQEKNRRGRKVEKGYCTRPEWADKDGCPMDNTNEEMTNCAGVVQGNGGAGMKTLAFINLKGGTGK